MKIFDPLSRPYSYLLHAEKKKQMNKAFPGSKISWLAGMILLGAASSLAWAASEEIQVYMDEMNAPREVGLDVHSNYVFSGSKVADYPGAQAPRHVFRVTPEFSYGLTPDLELGAYVLSSRDSRGNSAIDGQKLRLKYIILHGFTPSDTGREKISSTVRRCFRCMANDTIL